MTQHAAQPLDPDLAALAWKATWPLRQHAHQSFGQPRCPTRVSPYLSPSPVDPRCFDSECIGLYDEVYTLAAKRLRDRVDQRQLRNRDAYARQVLNRVVADLPRRDRAAQGQPARPVRSDGPAGRILHAIAAAADDPATVAWQHALFRLACCYVHRADRRATDWPLDMWGVEKSRYDNIPRVIGSRAAADEIRGDLGHILSCAENAAGRRWVVDNLLIPLQTTITTGLPEQPTADAGAPRVDAADHALINQVTRQLARLVTDGIDPDTAWTQAVREVTGSPPARPLSEVIDDLVHPDTNQPLQPQFQQFRRDLARRPSAAGARLGSSALLGGWCLSPRGGPGVVGAGPGGSVHGTWVSI